MRGFRSNSGPRAHYHQQYLAKNPNGYFGSGGCGVPFRLEESLVGEKAWSNALRWFTDGTSGSPRADREVSPRSAGSRRPISPATSTGRLLVFR
jgi:hypothetical protein